MQTQELIQIVTEAMEDMKAKDIQLIDVQDKTEIIDYMLIASGTSKRHLSAVAEEVVERVKKNGMQPRGIEGRNDSDWILADLGAVVVHVMLPSARSFYDLEGMWSLRPEKTADSSPD